MIKDLETYFFYTLSIVKLSHLACVQLVPPTCQNTPDMPPTMTKIKTGSSCDLKHMHMKIILVILVIPTLDIGGGGELF